MSTPKARRRLCLTSLESEGSKGVCAIGVAIYILGNVDWGQIGAIDVARWGTLYKTATSQTGTVLVGLDKNNGRAQESVTNRIS
jgi:hypothetical protein